jgi:hypothetical protein
VNMQRGQGHSPGLGDSKTYRGDPNLVGGLTPDAVVSRRGVSLRTPSVPGMGETESGRAVTRALPLLSRLKGDNTGGLQHGSAIQTPDRTFSG